MIGTRRSTDDLNDYYRCTHCQGLVHQDFVQFEFEFGEAEPVCVNCAGPLARDTPEGAFHAAAGREED